MPLTFAHPAAVLPFSRKNKYIHFSALVLGSMAPDFEYFLRGQPVGEVGHTLSGFFYFNLPLVAIIYLIYHSFIHQPLVNHLPAFLQDFKKEKVNASHQLNLIVFIYSALFGMLTHVIWDSFTHQNGFMVTKAPILAYAYNIFGFDISLYKILQHGSTLIGITIIIGYIYYRAKKSPKNANIRIKQKVIFWSLLIFLAIVFATLWILFDYVSVMNYGIIVVRIIDSTFVSLLIVSLIFSGKY
ncbi:DUF4184 family protein [bacterium LRH843]|nr:DUF4184 family protein [bacterium LRH843]